MKKIFTFVAMLFAAMSMNAQEPIAVTCAEAAAAMPAQHNDETQDVYIVTGYVTNTNGAISPSRTDATIDQQTFWMDDAKGSKKTVQGYWCNLPGHEALNVGDKISDSDKSQVETDLQAVKSILERTKDQEMSDKDLDELKAAKEKLMNSAQSLFTKMYESMQQAQGGAQAGPGPDMSGFAGGAGANTGANNAGGKNNDDVIDGDFREV